MKSSLPKTDIKAPMPPVKTPRGARFTQNDIARACKGVAAAGLDVARVIIDPNGQINIDVGLAAISTNNKEAAWDKVDF